MCCYYLRQLREDTLRHSVQSFCPCNICVKLREVCLTSLAPDFECCFFQVRDSLVDGILQCFYFTLCFTRMFWSSTFCIQRLILQKSNALALLDLQAGLRSREDFSRYRMHRHVACPPQFSFHTNFARNVVTWSANTRVFQFIH
jgi:hypothetical protein